MTTIKLSKRSTEQALYDAAFNAMTRALIVNEASKLGEITRESHGALLHEIEVELAKAQNKVNQLFTEIGEV